ncbi:MAG: CoA-binding protein [Aggregatilineales bacterium]
MKNLNLDDTAMRAALRDARIIAVVGHSDKAHRTSYRIAQFLRAVGYSVYPVNPTVDIIDGEKSYASLADLPETPDIVNVFRRSEHLTGIVDDAIAVGVKTIWTQPGVIDEVAQSNALTARLSIAMNRCIKVEHQCLGV